MTKSEAISWFRIQEMFRFQAFHMYGIIGTALACGIVMVQWMKRYEIKPMEGEEMQFKIAGSGFWQYILGGTFFGFGWALTGACPGPLYTLLGNGFTVFIVVILSAVLGTFCYGLLRDKLPH